MESQLLHPVVIHYTAGARRPMPHCAQRPSAPHCKYRRAPASPSKSWNSSPLTVGRKEAIGTKTRTLKGVTYPAYSSLRNTARAPRGVGETLKTPITGTQEIKTITKNNSRYINLNAE
jgi:hypothetical protein